MEHFTGSIKTKGKITYVEQEPFIFADTVRNNILFGSEYNEVRYNNVLEASALHEDLL